MLGAQLVDFQWSTAAANVGGDRMDKRQFLVASALFLISASFVLSKTIRDNHDAKILSGFSGVESNTQPEQN